MACTAKPVRIAVTTKPLDNWKSGSGHHLDVLMNHVLAIAEQDYPGEFEFTFVHYRKSDNPLYAEVREMLIPRNPLAASLRLAREKFDIIHYAPLSVFAPVWFVGSKRTATVHGIEEQLYPQGYTWVQRFHDCRIQPMYMRRMDGIATVSQTGRDWFVKEYRVKPDRVVLTPNAVSPLYRVLEDTPASLPPYVLHLSKFSPRKNPRGVIAGFAGSLSRLQDDIRLVCAGTGWDSEPAREMARAYGIEDRYDAPGFVSDEEAVRLMNGAGVFLFPSWAEGFGMPNLEAMACGCPVITSSVFAIPEVVGDAAITVSRPDAYDEISQALVRVLQDADCRQTLIQRGFARVQSYDWDSSARAILEYWRKLVSRAV